MSNFGNTTILFFFSINFFAVTIHVDFFLFNLFDSSIINVEMNTHAHYKPRFIEVAHLKVKKKWRPF